MIKEIYQAKLVIDGEESTCPFVASTESSALIMGELFFKRSDNIVVEIVSPAMLAVTMMRDCINKLDKMKGKHENIIPER